MVLGPRTKIRRSPRVHVDYLIHIREIKPWPPSQSSRTLRSVQLQWEHSDRNSGSTKAVVPSLGPAPGDWKIEFKESFRLPVTLFRDMSIKHGDTDVFLKNLLEFNLYEPRKDKTVKGPLLGTAIIDLALYGTIKETLSTSVLLNCRRNIKNTAQPALFIKLQQIEKDHIITLPRNSLSRESSLGKNGGHSASALTNEEYGEEAEVTSASDEDVSSVSSVISSSACESNGVLPAEQENSSRSSKDKEGAFIKEHVPSELESTRSGSPVNGHRTSVSSIMSVPKELVASSLQHSCSSKDHHATEDESHKILRSNGNDLAQDLDRKVAHTRSDLNGNAQEGTREYASINFHGKDACPIEDYSVTQPLSVPSSYNHLLEEVDGRTRTSNANDLREIVISKNIQSAPMKVKDENGMTLSILGDERGFVEDETVGTSSQEAASMPFPGNDASDCGENLGVEGEILNSYRHRHARSVRSSSDNIKNIRSARSSNLFSDEMKEIDVLRDAQKGERISVYERRNSKIHVKEMKCSSSNRIQQLEGRMKMLEGELREAAAIEVALYSVIAEHGSSMSKVHTPARRLSRLYLHACKEKFPSARGSAAKSAVSGLVLVAKGCGNDVPRLTFWLSNSVVLRAMVNQAIGEAGLLLSSEVHTEGSKARRNDKKSSPLKWKESCFSSMTEKKIGVKNSDNWEDPRTVISALEKVEAWIFSRIIESVWWQTLTPHMQSSMAKKLVCGDCGSTKANGRMSRCDDEYQGNFSLDHWKKAFEVTWERLCPVRAGGQQCGCLSVLARLVMEQCVARVDVAMFNAILRGSDNGIPTHPISDPISNPNVLPISAGKYSFGAGAQLKNVIGNWSRWLSDLSGGDGSFKSFHHLNALSDLLMLPKDMVLSQSTRKEVCPTIGTTLIRRVLNSFVPDEFCPDSVPGIVLEALNSEESLREEFLASAPPATVYSPPSAASIAGLLQPRLGRSVSLKSYASDDELDELDFPFGFIVCDDGSRASTLRRGAHGDEAHWLLSRTPSDANPERICIIQLTLNL